MTSKKNEYKPTIKQHEAWKYLLDNKTSHILYGGSVGSGKSHLGCMWIFLSCLKYPHTRYLIGRSRLSVLKRTTLKTLMEIIKHYNYNSYEYNSVSNTITLGNGSEIILMDLFPYPADDNYDRLGSLEITGAFIDELSEISYKGFEVLFTRIRYKIKEYNLLPKIFCASNPTIGWPKDFFYKPYMEKNQKEHVRFIPALPTDNKYLPYNYLEGLGKNLTGSLRERLLKGSWDFDSDDYAIFNYDNILQMFYNDAIGGEKYISCDVANIGTDKTVIGVWNGLECFNIYVYEKKDTEQVVNIIKEKMSTFNVKIKNVIIDADGLGIGVADYLKGCVPFKGGSVALNKENYKNLRSQCYMKLADMISDIKIVNKYKEQIIQDLQAHKLNDPDSEGKTSIISKDKIKAQIGRSPDYSDMLMMRMFFEIKKPRQKTYVY